jgi:dipeptidyl aminopeptidase/acylaminoacyl peptidase
MWNARDAVLRVLAHTSEAPGPLAWSPRGDTLAFSMFVPAARRADDLGDWQRLRTANWARAAVVTDQLVRRAEGHAAELRSGLHQIFLADTDSGALRQLTDAPVNHGGPLCQITKLSNAGSLSWDADGRKLVTWPLVTSSSCTSDASAPRGSCAPQVSPDGRWIAFVGFRDRRLAFHTNELFLMPRDGGEPRALAHPQRLEVHQDHQWLHDSSALRVSLIEHGDGCLAQVDLAGAWHTLCRDLGGSLSTGYVRWAKGVSIAADGAMALAHGSAERTDEVVVRRWTGLSDGDYSDVAVTDHGGWLSNRQIALPHMQWLPTTPALQSWLVRPPAAAPGDKVPLLLWLHGGPYLAWGPHWHFAAQRWAQMGFAVLMVNGRGSLGYGEAHIQALHHNFPGQDDLVLLDAVQAVIDRGGIDADRIFVAGESAGGVMSSWLIGHTTRFRAAAVIYGVMDWCSAVLTQDRPDYYPYYWLAAPPWEAGMHEVYWQRSPLSRVAAVRTPTLVMCGDDDWRTPVSQSELYFTALKLCGVEAELVRFPDDNHGLEWHPSHWVELVERVGAWFKRHGQR